MRFSSRMPVGRALNIYYLPVHGRQKTLQYNIKYIVIFFLLIQ